jgi:hypothetical protein
VARRGVRPLAALVGVGLCFAAAGRGLAQDPAAGLDPNAGQATAEDDAFADIDKLTEKLKKQKEKAERPPFEFSHSQVAPLDILPLVKPHHWITLSVELRSNLATYEGLLQSANEVNGRPQVPLLEMPRAMIYRRDALLPAEQLVWRSLQVMLPNVPRRLILELTQPGRIRPDFGIEALTQRLEPHQMLVLVLAADPNPYNGWLSMQATLPSDVPRDATARERARYYRLVLPMKPARPNLSPHPLTWTTISHVVWDGLAPEALGRGSFSAQQALIDWLHWGGQLIVIGTGPNAAALEDSALGAYLPATVTGQTDPLSPEELSALSAAYPPPFWGGDLEGWVDSGFTGLPVVRGQPPRSKAPVPITPATRRPLNLVRLEPKALPGVTTIPVAPGGSRWLAVERRVGRGRVTMLAVNPNDPALVAWPGLDTLVRRVVFRRPEETWARVEDQRRGYQPLGGPRLSWLRLLGRDLGVTAAGNEGDPNDVPVPGEVTYSKEPVAAWIDTTAEMPKRTRDSLERASGITIPGNGFVLRVVLAYLVALVPLNWLICRFVFRRRELAWVIAPLLALGFAYGVERAAAVDLGFDVACDEIDLVEIHGAYPRAHVSRFASLYSSGRNAFRVADPDNPTALTLPMRSYQVLRGEEVGFSAFESSPESALSEFLVQPRSLAMFRSESVVDLGGGITFEGDFERGRIVNGTELELLDAVLIDVDAERVRSLGRVAPWPRDAEQAKSGAHIVDLGRADAGASEASVPPEVAWSELRAYLDLLRAHRWHNPEDAGEIRLVAWARDAHPGQVIAPKPDRHRGVRLVVAHLRFGLPHPGDPAYHTPTFAQDDDAEANP